MHRKSWPECDEDLQTVLYQINLFELAHWSRGRYLRPYLDAAEVAAGEGEGTATAPEMCLARARAAAENDAAPAVVAAAEAVAVAAVVEAWERAAVEGEAVGGAAVPVGSFDR